MAMLDNPWYKCPEPEFLWCCGLVSINVSYLIIELISKKKKNLHDIDRILTG